MKFKASLHLHTAEDPDDGKLIDYSASQIITQAAASGFKVLAITCHHHFVYNQSLVKQAEKLEVLLLPGIELELAAGPRRAHVVVLNCQPEIAELSTLMDLFDYKAKHPEIFVMAAHPNSDWHFSLGLKRLADNADLFDAFEHTWFYSRWPNANRAVAKLAKKFSKPFIATADLHDRRFLEGDYTVIEAGGLTTDSIIKALKAGRIKNFSSPKNWFEMFWFLLRFLILKPFLTLGDFRGKKQ